MGEINVVLINDVGKIFNPIAEFIIEFKDEVFELKMIGDKMTIKAKLCIQFDYFNSHANTWEPTIENTNISYEMKTYQEISEENKIVNKTEMKIMVGFDGIKEFKDTNKPLLEKKEKDTNKDTKENNLS